MTKTILCSVLCVEIKACWSKFSPFSMAFVKTNIKKVYKSMTHL